LLPLLEVLDGFEHALQVADMSPSIAEGMQMIYRKLLALLEEEGITL
jgi:molecular chaperone GrpE (heat shock protein)